MSSKRPSALDTHHHRARTPERLTAIAVATMMPLIQPAEADASHFRYAHITWVPRQDIAPNTAEFVVTAALRRNGYSGSGADGRPVTGDIITEVIGMTRLFFDDGNCTSVLRFRVVAYDPVKNWIVGRALRPGGSEEFISHSYPSPLKAGGTPWEARLDTCCRIGVLRNCGHCGYRLATLVRFDIPNKSPVSSLPPIVNVPINSLYSFFVPAIDADGDVLTRRFATAGESGITDPIGPEGTLDADQPLLINSLTGEVGWDTNGGTDVGNLFTTQVVIEERRGGALIGRTAIDFLLEITPQGNAPTCTIEPASAFIVSPGIPVSFNVHGADADEDESLMINTGGLPTGATMTPPLPLSGPAAGVMSTFNWTPTEAQGGQAYVVAFTITDDIGLQSSCAVTIQVLPTPTGACCFSDGSCRKITENNCGRQGGAYQGDHVTCEAAGCPPPTGACCLSDGSCAEMVAVDCLGQEGRYRGNWTLCSDPRIRCPACGNGVCDVNENCNTCPVDCGDCCGNGVCELAYGEDPDNCPDCLECLVNPPHIRWYRDNDRDGVGVCHDTHTNCVPLYGYTTTVCGDCDDNDPEKTFDCGGPPPAALPIQSDPGCGADGGLCGLGLAGAMPLSLLGLLCLKRRR